jgi:hypothetical protein
MVQKYYLQDFIFNSRGKNNTIFVCKKRQVGMTTFLANFANDVGNVLYIVHSKSNEKIFINNFGIPRTNVIVTSISDFEKYYIGGNFDFVIFDECQLDKVVNIIDQMGITCPKIITASKECSCGYNDAQCNIDVYLNKYCSELKKHSFVQWVDINETIKYVYPEKKEDPEETKLTLEYHKNQMFEMVWARMSISEINRENILPIKTLEAFLKRSVAIYNTAYQKTYTANDLDFLVKNTDIIVHGMICQALAARTILQASMGATLPEICSVLQDQYKFETDLYYRKLYSKI